MVVRAINQSHSDSDLVCGVLSRHEAGMAIARGTRHIHSSPLLEADPCVVITKGLLMKKFSPDRYPWEAQAPKTLTLVKSVDRHVMIQKAVSETGVGSRRELRERVEMATEELLTNALYHAYRNFDGFPKYRRRDRVHLSPGEQICFQYAGHQSGIYLSILDRGGSLRFSDVSGSFKRCYSDKKNQLETKEQGAGLGFYMVFEVVTHLKVTVSPNLKSRISCWLSDNRVFDPDTFSFNYFEKEVKE